MKITETPLAGLLIIEPRVFSDHRGFFFESYNLKQFAENGILANFVQDNHSRSAKSTVRGLHYQVNPGQDKLVRVIAGEIFDVAVDIRRNSPTFGQWYGCMLTSENKKQLYVPIGFAHGFCVTSENAEVIYKCTDFYSPKDERGIAWNDSAIGIKWPVKTPILSAKDKQHPRLAVVPPDSLFML
ncbi:dTDP-4-dehydrorhamnose 3,5-epimerase [candidate division KSB1 bacterium]|nr:dTDP-4-dehydrorhamnose 3,5-epimerase [candidate division KSB1 bacterium]